MVQRGGAQALPAKPPSTLQRTRVTYHARRSVTQSLRLLARYSPQTPSPRSDHRIRRHSEPGELTAENGEYLGGYTMQSASRASWRNPPEKANDRSSWQACCDHWRPLLRSPQGFGTSRAHRQSIARQIELPTLNDGARHSRDASSVMMPARLCNTESFWDQSRSTPKESS